MKISDVPDLKMYKQNTYMLTTSFDFHSEHLEYTCRHWNLAHSGFNLPYHDLPNKADYSIYSPKPPLIMGLFFISAIILLVNIFSFGYSKLSSPRYFVFLIVVIGFLFLFNWALVLVERRLWRKRCTVLRTPAGNIGIAHDKQHDIIVEELQARRATALMKYAAINDFENPWKQIKRLKFLLEQSLITEDQFAAYRQKLFALQSEPHVELYDDVSSSRAH
jgi:hypothetical protein